MPRSLAGETIGVLGLARSGLAATRLALSRGAAVYASDAGASDAAKEAAEQVRALGGDAEVGGHDLGKLAACGRIVLSPGIPPTAQVLKEEAIRGVPVIPEIEFAYDQLDSPVIAITGTNGKTTVTALIEHLLRADGIDAVAGGNIGTALSELAMREPQPAWAVVECSSFQLAGIDRFTPRIGILTNLAPDHLDWYSDVEDYYADKARLFTNASAGSRWILNAEDERARTLIGDAPGARLYFRAQSMPVDGYELGGWVGEGGEMMIRTEPGRTERVADAAELQILGPHNVANALAAALAARLAGASVEGIASGLRTFQAPAHRLEPVVERDGVLWINDSKATNIASTRVAVRGMTRPTVLLLGGKHKGEPYTELLGDLGHVKTILAYGEAAPTIVADLEGKAPVERVDGCFDDVVEHARRIARPGDAVLLSPACSSFDMFKNYEERGRRFAQLAREGA
jgi:UDP-N-acetylmuramoylalanine--D-glutamate ligase